MNIMTQMMKKKEKACLKSIIWKFENDPYDPNFDLFKCVGDINLYILNLCEKKTTQNKAVNKVINKIIDDFEKLIAVTKLKKI